MALHEDLDCDSSGCPEGEESSVSSTGSPVDQPMIPSVASCQPSGFTIAVGHGAGLFNKLNAQVVELNNFGVLFYNKGEFATSEAFFQNGNSLLSQSRGNTPLSPNHAMVAPTLTVNANSSIVFSVPAISAPTTGVASAPTATIPECHDVEEGLGHVYTRTELLSAEYGDPHFATAATTAMIEATLLYNLAQVKRRLNPSSNESHALYERAFQTVQSSLLLNATSSLATDALMSLFPQQHLTFSTSNLVHIHQILLPALYHMGLGLYRQQRLGEAAAYFKLVLDQSLVWYGDQSFAAGVALQALGVVQYHRMIAPTPEPNGTVIPQSSLQYLLQALQIWLVTLPPNDPVVAATFHNIGRVLIARKEYEQTTIYLEQALQLRRFQCGIDHVDTVWTVYLMGLALSHQADPDRALPFYKEFLRHTSPSFNKTHRDVAFSLSSIAQSYEQRKDYVKAREIYEESLVVGRAALGNRDPDIGLLLNRVGNFYFDREMFDEALRIYREGFGVERAVLRPSHPNIIVTYFNIGEIHKKKGNYVRAIKLYTKAMYLQKEHFGDNSPEVAASLNAIGWLYEQNGHSKVAIRHLQDALVMRRTVLGDDHLDVSASLNDVGTLFCRNTMFHDALEVLNEALRIRTLHLGQDHRDVSFTLYNIGLCHQAQGNYVEAHTCFCDTLRIEELVLGKSHKDVALTIFKLGEVHKLNGELDKALDCFQRALDIDKVLFQDEPFILAKTLNEIGNIHLVKGNIPDMMAAFAEAARLYIRGGRPLSSPILSPSLRLYDARFQTMAPVA